MRHYKPFLILKNLRPDKKIKLLLSLLFCIASICIFLPGSYSNDSWAQYIHMTKNWHDDWFGPAMVCLWGALWSVTRTYISLYFFQMIAYWLFITLLAWDRPLASVRFWIVMLSGLFLCFIPQYLMRDSLMAMSWGLASLLVLHPHYIKHKKIAIWTILVLSTYGLWLRPNALAALLPFALAIIITVRERQTILRQLLLAAGLTCLFFAATNILTYVVFRAAKTYPGYKLQLLDITGISKLSGHNYLPACVTTYPTFNYDELLKTYTPATFDHIYWSDRKLIPPPDAALSACVHRSWVTAITAHPLLYLENRTEGFLYYLRIKKRFKNEDYWNVTISIDPENPLGLKTQPNKTRDQVKDMYNSLGNTCFFDPWLWLVLNIVAFIFTLTQYRQSRENYLKVLACIQLSGIFYMLSQFAIYQHDQDFRYNYWNVFVILITIGAFRKSGKKAAYNSSTEGLKA